MTQSAAQLAQAARSRRGNVIRWLRNTHGWLGLWGAGLGLLFGATGILLNHRQVMKLPYAQYEKTNIELKLPAQKPTSAKALSVWLQAELDIKKSPLKIEDEPVKKVTWNGVLVEQPALWKVDFHTPQYSVAAEYWVGNQFVSVKRQEANVFAFLSRLHKGVGMNAGWILLADSLAGALIMLSLTGLLLWTKMRKSRLLLAGLSGGSILLAVTFSLYSL
jgi:hypothetical protein